MTTAANEPTHRKEDRENASGDRRSRSRGIWLFLRDTIIIVLCAVILSMAIKTFLVRSFYIPTGSMKDTLQVDDRILVNQLVPGLIPIARGDVVVFQDPGGWLAHQQVPEQSGFVAWVDWVLTQIGLSAADSNDHLIKRVIGLPGDTVVCCNQFGQLTVNGVSIDETYLRLPAGVSKASGIEFSVTVPEGSLWVLGDNRYDSADSRLNRDKPGKGFVPVDNVVGRAFVVSWPISHWGWLDNFPTVFSGVPEQAPPTSAGTEEAP